MSDQWQACSWCFDYKSLVWQSIYFIPFSGSNHLTTIKPARFPPPPPTSAETTAFYSLFLYLVLCTLSLCSAQIMDNAEINNVIKIIGLHFKENYDDPTKLSQLRYGKLMIMTDQDQDGSHIKGLLINFIHHFWPSLLRHNFVEEFITPIVKVWVIIILGSLDIGAHVFLFFLFFSFSFTLIRNYIIIRQLD